MATGEAMLNQSEQEICKELIGLTTTKDQLNFLTQMIEQRYHAEEYKEKLINNLLDRLEKR